MPDTRLLGGRYELGETLGYGGMAEVYAGRDIRLGRAVAIKVLRADLARDPSFQTRFRREAQAAASLSHPAVVSIYDTGEDVADGEPGSAGGSASVPYIVMEYVEGRTLRDVLAQEGPLLPRRALEVVAEVCAALEYSHRAGIVHRDIKPANVMLTPDGEIKVMDFGIARAVTASSATVTQTAAVIGTAQYLSPEQARGEHVDARSDVYSTGCLLYELLTGQPPFTGDSPVAVAYQHVREDPQRPSTRGEEITPGIDAIVLKALAKNPANRYQTAADMRADLERAIAGRPVLATPVQTEPPTTVVRPVGPATATVVRGPAPRYRREPETRRGWAYLALAAAVIVVFVAAVLLTRGLLSAGGSSVATPNLNGLTLGQARVALQHAGLRLGTVSREFNDAKVGTVIDQSPLSVVASKKGQKVDVTLSKGIQTTAVPTVTGLSQDDAKAKLAQAKLALGNVTPQDDPASPGTVLSQSVAPGTTVRLGAQVSIVVSTGKVDLPNVVRLSQSDATAQLKSAGFAVNALPQSVTDPTQNGIVLSENPTTPTAVKGSTVTITVGQLTAPPPPPPPTASPTPSSTPVATATPSSTPGPSQQPTIGPTSPTPTPTPTF